MYVRSTHDITTLTYNIKLYIHCNQLQFCNILQWFIPVAFRLPILSLAPTRLIFVVKYVCIGRWIVNDPMCSFKSVIKDAKTIWLHRCRIGLVPSGWTCYLIFGPFYPIPFHLFFCFHLYRQQRYTRRFNTLALSRPSRERERERILLLRSITTSDMGPASLRLQPVVSIFFPTQKQLIVEPIKSLRAGSRDVRSANHSSALTRKAHPCSNSVLFASVCAGPVLSRSNCDFFQRARSCRSTISYFVLPNQTKNDYLQIGRAYGRAMTPSFIRMQLRQG